MDTEARKKALRGGKVIEDDITGMGNMALRRKNRDAIDDDDDDFLKNKQNDEEEDDDVDAPPRKVLLLYYLIVLARM